MNFRSGWELRITIALLAILIFPFISRAEASSGNYLPDSATTPGSINSSVNQNNISTTICLSGYTATIRPSSNYTTRIKEHQLRTLPYAAYGDTRNADFEEDHLISLELGGNPTDPKNLWPEPWSGADGAHIKDKIENKLHSLVCSNTMLLSTAQNLIATDWVSAYSIYVLGKGEVSGAEAKQSAISTPQSTPTPSRQINVTPPNWPAGVTAKCKDGTYSSAVNHRGACSRHHGVAIFKP